MLENNKYIDAEKLVDQVISTSPGFSLPDSFAEMVAEKVSRKFAWEQYLKEFLIYLGVFLGIGIVTGVIVFIGLEYNLKDWITFITANVSLIISIYVISIFILFADRVLLRYFMFKSKIEVV